LSKLLLSIFFVIFFINGCDVSNKIENNVIKKKPSFFTKKSNFMLLNFDSATEKIISKILKNNNKFAFKNTLFFIDLLENNTNILINTEKLTDLIKNKFVEKNNKINFLKKEIIQKNKKKLGLLKIKNTLDTSTAILISRNNNVNYYLHSCISGKNEPFLLKIELILVKTGEIVFMQKEKFYW